MSKKITSIEDLMEHNHTFKIAHPVIGTDHDGTITIRSTNCSDYHFKKIELSRSLKDLQDAKDVDQEIAIAKRVYEDTIKVIATLVVSWNESFFKRECTYENVVNLLLPMEMSWLRDQIYKEAGAADNFFTHS